MYIHRVYIVMIIHVYTLCLYTCINIVSIYIHVGDETDRVCLKLYKLLPM